MAREVYKNYKFRISFSDPVTGQFTQVAGFTNISGLGRAQDNIEYRAGEDDNEVDNLDGLVKYGMVAFERGMSVDMEFLEWAEQMIDKVTEEVNLGKSILVEVLVKTGTVGKAYVLKNARPRNVELTELNSTTSGVLFERIVVVVKGWTIYKGDNTTRGYDV